MSKKAEYKHGDICIVHEGDPIYKEGAVVAIIDKDKFRDSYICARLEEVGKTDSDINKLLNNYSQWVDSEHLSLISFRKKKKNYLPILLPICAFVTGLLLGTYL